MKRILALILCVGVLLSGCTPLKHLSGISRDYTRYEDMVYERPDMDALTQVLDESCRVARSETDIDAVVEAILGYYDAYDWFYTNYDLAYIEYQRDMTSEAWAEEYSFCEENAPTVEAGLEDLYYALAKSPIREELEREAYFGAGYFDAYENEEESIYDETFLGMLEQEGDLIGEYYELCSQAEEEEYYSQAYFDGYAQALCALLVELVALRQEMAAYAGYDSYAQFAYDCYYYRDYTPEQAVDYMEQISTHMSGLYQQVSRSDVWDGGSTWCAEGDTFRYLEEAVEAMGGVSRSAFTLMEKAGLYDIARSDKKFNVSFELYLFGYAQPYVFVNPDGYSYDKLSFAHEFGHFVTDYACGGSYAGTDVLEVFSQGMEYLCLRYDGGEDALERYKLADCLSTYVEQSAYACFEHRLYELEGEELTTGNVFRLYEETCRSFGIDFEYLGWDPRDLVAVPHFFTDPMYIISYVVSNDGAFQLYSMELEEPGAGLAKFEETVTTESSYFLEFMEEAGLETPFAPGRVERVAQVLEELLEP